MPVQSVLDNDLYTFTVQQAVLNNFPRTSVEYSFTDRRGTVYNDEFIYQFDRHIDMMSNLSVSRDETKFFEKWCPFIHPDHLAYIHDYKFDPNELKFGLDKDGHLKLDIRGDWERAIMWEVPLLATISECYFKTVDTDWNEDPLTRSAIAVKKARKLAANNCLIADFGTRRRRNYDEQFRVVQAFKENCNTFVGTSNVHLARLFDVKPIGTMSHQWIMGVSAIDGIRHANRHALQRWNKTYQGNLGIALPDTFGTGAFFEDFNLELAKLYDGIRHDSGDPIEFGEKVITHYQKLGINPMHKFCIFTDGLDVDTAIVIQKHFQGRINVSFGIGTHLTNDFLMDGSKALNIVIKLSFCNGVPVVKLSDVSSKAIGDRDALRVAMWTFFNKPLDNN